MFTLDLKVDESPIVNVVTTQNRGFTPKKLPTVAPKKSCQFLKIALLLFETKLLRLKRIWSGLLLFTCEKLFAVTALLCIMLLLIQVIQS